MCQYTFLLSYFFFLTIFYCFFFNYCFTDLWRAKRFSIHRYWFRDYSYFWEECTISFFHCYFQLLPRTLICVFFQSVVQICSPFLSIECCHQRDVVVSNSFLVDLMYLGNFSCQGYVEKELVRCSEWGCHFGIWINCYYVSFIL